MKLKLAKRSLVVLVLTLVVSCLVVTTNGAAGTNPPLTWSVPGAKLSPQDIAASVNKALGKPTTSNRWQCGVQPKPTLGTSMFTVDYNYDYSITSQSGTTGVNAIILANEGISWSAKLSDVTVNQPTSQQSDDFSYLWTFTGSSSSSAPSRLISFGYCVAVFTLKPWGSYELQSSNWTKPTPGSTYKLDPSLPKFNQSDKTVYQLMAMQAVMRLGS